MPELPNGLTLPRPGLQDITKAQTGGTWQQLEHNDTNDYVEGGGARLRRQDREWQASRASELVAERERKSQLQNKSFFLLAEWPRAAAVSIDQRPF